MSKTEKARRLFDLIADGHENTLLRPADKYIDRALRDLVLEANKTGDCIINVGNGYYRPVPGDPVDTAEFNHYRSSELKRAREILLKRLKMTIAFKEKGVISNA